MPGDSPDVRHLILAHHQRMAATRDRASADRAVALAGLGALLGPDAERRHVTVADAAAYAQAVSEVFGPTVAGFMKANFALGGVDLGAT